MSSLLFPETRTIGQHEAQLMFQGTNTCIVESCVKHHNHNPPPLLCRERINHILINNHKINWYTSLLLTYFVIKYMNRVEELALPIQLSPIGLKDRLTAYTNLNIFIND